MSEDDSFFTWDDIGTFVTAGATGATCDVEGVNVAVTGVFVEAYIVALEFTGLLFQGAYKNDENCGVAIETKMDLEETITSLENTTNGTLSTGTDLVATKTNSIVTVTDSLKTRTDALRIV